LNGTDFEEQPVVKKAPALLISVEKMRATISVVQTF
jgi:hypothetical protein